MAVNWVGVSSLIVFYVLVLAVGLFAAWRKKRKQKSDMSETEDHMLAGRNMGYVVGFFSMTATWVDGGFINGTAEVMFSKGLIWCQGPVGFSISLLIAGVFFAKKMRDKNYVTMLDPFQQKYGMRVGALLYIPAVLGEILWTAAILNALGATVEVVVGLDRIPSVIASGVIAIIYTLAGGMYSVTYTDIIELICIFFGLWLCVPFTIKNPHVGDISDVNWLGTIEDYQIASYIDTFIMLILGGIPWQAYFQRVLSSKDSRTAQVLSITAGFVCLIMAVPSAIIGVVAQVVRWNETDYPYQLPMDPSQSSLILPSVLQFLTPKAVAFVGLGTVSAAVMSSCDASILSASSMFTRNIYCMTIRPKASDREQMWVFRFAMIFIGAIATTLALTATSIYGLWILSSDLVYVLLFPQLLAVLYFPGLCNSYGAVSGLIISLVLRLIGGEPTVQLPVAYEYPYYDPTEGQLFPFKTLAMVVGLVCMLVVTALTNFSLPRLPGWVDFLGVLTYKDGSLKELAPHSESDSTLGDKCNPPDYDSTHM